MPLSERSFFDLYAQNFVRAAVAIPRVALNGARLLTYLGDTLGATVASFSAAATD